MPLVLDELRLRGYAKAEPGVITAEEGRLQLQNVDINSVIDSSALTARARINNARLDREGDIIEPSGVDWTDYQFVPSVMFDHGFSGIPFPIAKSETPEGVCTVSYDVDEDALYGVSYFSDKSELSYQIFGLIEEGLLRAVSIHVDPVEDGVRALAGGRFHVLKSNMVEYSWCTLGCNPDAYAKGLRGRDSKVSEALHLQLEAASKILKRGTIGNARLMPSLLKCIKSLKPDRLNIVTGHTPEDSMGTKTLTQDQIKKLGHAALAKALSDLNQWDVNTAKGLRSFAKSLEDDGTMPKADLPEDTATTDATETPAIGGEGGAAAGSAEGEIEKSEGAEDAPATGGDMPMGAQFISAFHSNLNSLLTTAEAEAARVENPKVVEGVSPAIEGLRATIAELEGLFGSVYPEQSPLAGEASSEDSDVAKSWMSQNRSQFQLMGIAQRLSGVVNGSVPAGQVKSLLTRTVKDLQVLTSAAKSFKPPAPKDMVPKAQFDALQKSHQADRDKLKKLVNKLKGEAADV